MSPSERASALAFIAGAPEHMREALGLALADTEAECAEAPPAPFDAHLHMALLSAVFHFEGTGEAFARARRQMKP